MNKRNLTRLFAIGCVFAGGTSQAVASINVTLIGPSAYDPDINVLNANLGISDSSQFRFEEFEDGPPSELGLSITVTGHSSYTIRTGAEVDDEVWSLNGVLHNVDSSGIDGQDVTFGLLDGANMFGVGISHLEQSTSIIVNGIELVSDIRDLTNWQSGGPNVRNGYLWIEATDGDVISTVKFDVVTSSDTVLYDHVAWRPVPAPGALALFGMGVLKRGARRRRNS